MIGDSSVGAPPAGHYIPSTSHPVLRASHLVPYTSHAGLDMASIEPSLKPVQLYSLSGGDSSSNRATGGFLDKLAKVPVPLPPMPDMEVFDRIGRDLHALRAPVGKIVYHASKTVTTVGDFVSDAYDDLTQSYPFIKDVEPYARCGGWVAVGAGRGTLAGGLSGALAGASTGMYTCVGDKVISEVINHVAGDQIAAGVQGGVDALSQTLQSNPYVDEQTAHAAAATIVGGAMLVVDAKDTIKVGASIGKIKPKLSLLDEAEGSSASSVVNHYSESTSAPSGKLSRAAAEVEHEFASIDEFVPTKEQPWNVRAGQEWKMKIHGTGQKTGKAGATGVNTHARASYELAVEYAKDPSVTEVYLNLGMNKVLDAKKGDPHYMSTNRRPDVVFVTQDGKIHQIEVPSASDREKLLWQRMEDTRLKLPESMKGRTDVIYPKERGKR